MEMKLQIFILVQDIHVYMSLQKECRNACSEKKNYAGFYKLMYQNKLILLSVQLLEYIYMQMQHPAGCVLSLIPGVHCSSCTVSSMEREDWRVPRVSPAPLSAVLHSELFRKKKSKLSMLSLS